MYVIPNIVCFSPILKHWNHSALTVAQKTNCQMWC